MRSSKSEYFFAEASKIEDFFAEASKHELNVETWLSWVVNLSAKFLQFSKYTKYIQYTEVLQIK